MLTPEQHAKLIAHINAKWKNQACWLCTTNNWNVAAYASVFVQDRIGLVIGAPVLPLVILTCNNCGNTVFLNAFIAGVPPGVPPPAADFPVPPVSPNRGPSFG